MSRVAKKDFEMEMRGRSRPGSNSPSASTTVAFYTQINNLLRPDMKVLNLGAGRGAGFERSKNPHEISLYSLRGKVREYVGADPDHAAIARNMHVDRRVPIEAGKPLPFHDGEFDLVLSDWVLEHVTEPAQFASEVSRVLKPGGWFCARTPNRWGLTAMGARLIPSSQHHKVLRRLTPQRQEVDIFPTAYRLNTRSRIQKFFPARDWTDHSFMMNGQGVYFRRTPILAKIVKAYWSVAPDDLKNLILIFLQKRQTKD